MSFSSMLIYRKTFLSENAYRSHVQSKKHRDKEAYNARQPIRAEHHSAVEDTDRQLADVGSDSGSDEEMDIEERLASARRRYQASDCLFCSTRLPSIELSVLHMASSHSFFLPDQDHLADLPGLLLYLGEKVVVGNICLYCPNGGKEFGTVESVRRHMVDKGHCKLAYDTDEDRAEVADYYIFDAGSEDEWEDMENESGVGREKGESAVSS